MRACRGVTCGRTRGERGAVLVEAAICVPLVILLVFGVVEMGWLYFNHGTAQNMSVVGARSGSGQGNEAPADYEILRAVTGGSSGMSAASIQAVVVYRATGPDDRVPETCKTQSVDDLCNFYTGADLSLDEDQFGCVGPPGPATKKDNFWCPTTRKTALTGSNGPPDYLGVYVRTTGDSILGVLGESLTLTADTVTRIEPRTQT